MERKILEKYHNSRLNGILIRDISVYKSGKIIINAENGEVLESWINANIGYSDNILDYSGDYILCSMQDRAEINICK